ncbi:hypothetical protein ACFLY2_00255 [Patescibacteria group bacterium]
MAVVGQEAFAVASPQSIFVIFTVPLNGNSIISQSNTQLYVKIISPHHILHHTGLFGDVSEYEANRFGSEAIFETFQHEIS